MKTILIIGLGRFGRHMARNLTEMDNEVMAVDIVEDRVNDVLSYVTNAQIGDATKEVFLQSLGVGNFDICVVAIGDNFQSSLETTCLLKELGAKYVIARASRDVHAKFLLRNGADKVIYPERETAERLAVKCSANNLFEYIELTPNYSIYEISVPEAWVGKSIVQNRSARNFISAYWLQKEDTVISPLPSADYVFKGTETIIIMGHNDDVKKLLK